MTEIEREYWDRTPQELNEEFRKVLGALPTVALSILGTIETEDLEMSEEEEAAFLEIINQPNPFEEVITNLRGGQPRTLEEKVSDLDDYVRELFILQAKGKVLMNRRERMFYGRILIAKLEDLLPFVKGTESFKEWIKKDLQFWLKVGRSDGGKDHWLYGDDKGGIFHPDSVEAIEERSLRHLKGDVDWYGVSPPLYVRVFEADYDNDPYYRSMVDLGRHWKEEFINKYGRAPVDLFGREINFP